MATEPLKFIVAPHIVEDLGLNLYTDLPRVLVEYVANAHDADSPFADVRMDLDRIRDERKRLRLAYDQERLDLKLGATEESALEPLSERTLPEDIKIVIEDAGLGMSREDFEKKFLIAGRRRRDAERELDARTPGGRPLMGRKGLGKLAGFGVAKTVCVESRREGETHATRITLRYEDLIRHRDVNSVEVPDEHLEDGGGFEIKGTRIILSRLLYDPLKSREKTLTREVNEHFEFVQAEEFSIRLNGEQISREPREHAFAWPEPETDIEDLADLSMNTEVGLIACKYRIRFTVDRAALTAKKRGIRVYVGHRLAAAPSLLDMDTNMHGFRMTDYLDGVVQADFLDHQKTDYIATDRQSLRWDTPLLAPLRKELSAQMTKACTAYQKTREGRNRSKVRDDPFTKKLVESQSFSRGNTSLAFRIATYLANACKRSVDDPDYRNKLPVLVQAIGHGSVLTEISKIAGLDRPDLERMVVQVARLTRHELDQFVSYAKARLKAIEALKRIVENQDFKKAQNEKLLQELFEKAPWLLDPTYTQFLTADQPEHSLFKRLAKSLEIGSYAPAGSKSTMKRPDLVFLIGNTTLRRLVVVELKSANLPLDSDHLTQLKYYTERADTWLRAQRKEMQVHGHLLGTRPDPKSQAEKVVVLLGEIKRAGPESPWRVRDYLDVLEDTLAAHNELVDIYRSIDEGEFAEN